MLFSGPFILQRQQIIDSVMARQPTQTPQAMVALWERLASEIASLMGDAGFDSLYDRSVHLTEASFPWLVSSAPPADPRPRLKALSDCLSRQSPADIGGANALLLLNFTNTLASLIGEALTINILNSAWGDDASHQFGKEPQQ